MDTQQTRLNLVYSYAIAMYQALSVSRETYKYLTTSRSVGVHEDTGTSTLDSHTWSAMTSRHRAARATSRSAGWPCLMAAARHGHDLGAMYANAYANRPGIRCYPLDVVTRPVVDLQSMMVRHGIHWTRQT